MEPDGSARAPSCALAAAPGRSKVVSFRGPDVHCPGCGVRHLCLPPGLDDPTTRKLEALFGAPRRLARRAVLYRTGEPFTALHAVRVGTLKSVVLGEDGRNQITGYYMAGDIVGLEGLGQAVHTRDAIALEDSEVCALPVNRLHELASDPAVQHHLFELMARDLRRGEDLIVLLGCMRAEERLATYLLDVSHRNRLRGFSAREFVLRMTREEIASFLGLKLETVSRVFSRMHAEGLIQVQGRAVKLLDVAQLRRMVRHDCWEQEPAWTSR